MKKCGAKTAKCHLVCLAMIGLPEVASLSSGNQLIAYVNKQRVGVENFADLFFLEPWSSLHVSEFIAITK